MGSSPATIKTVLNEAAIIAARDNNGIIDRKILDEAWMKQLMEGHLRRNGERNNIEVVAWHEAGHALAGLLLGQDLTKASIIPSTSGAGGATFITPKKLGLFTVKELKEQVIMLYAGRNAEALLTESNGEEEGVTTGASNDIEKATDIIKKMIVEYGMNDEFGLLNLDNLDVKPEVITKEAVKLAKALQEQSLILEKLQKDNFFNRMTGRGELPISKVAGLHPPDDEEHEYIEDIMHKKISRELLASVLWSIIGIAFIIVYIYIHVKSKSEITIYFLSLLLCLS